MIDERNVGTAFFDSKLYKMHINSTDKKGGKHNESFK